MHPQHEKLTPRQTRAVLSTFLLICLLFVAIIVNAAWKGELAREAIQRARIAQAKQDAATRKKERNERRKRAKVDEGKLARKSDMAQIQRGTTGVANSTGPVNGGGVASFRTISTQQKWIITGPEGAEKSAAGIVTPKGWGVTQDGHVTVPLTATPGRYNAAYFAPLEGTASGDFQQYNEYPFAFEVVKVCVASSANRLSLQCRHDILSGNAEGEPDNLIGHRV